MHGPRCQAQLWRIQNHDDHENPDDYDHDYHDDSYENGEYAVDDIDSHLTGTGFFINVHGGFVADKFFEFISGISHQSKRKRSQ